MAIRRNYFFENITEEDPTKAVADPNLLDYDKTDSYSQTTPVGDEGVAGTVDTDLGDGKEEEIKGDGTPTLEQLLIEESMIEEMAEMVLEAKIENEEDFKRALKEIDGKPGAIMKAIGIYYGFFSKIYGVTSFMKTGKVNPQLVVVSIIGTPLTTAMVGFIAKQTADKQVKLRAYRRLEKKISKTISKLEKQKDKEGVDVKALDKKIKDLKKSQSIVEKKISETEKIKDAYTRESAGALDFDSYMESVFSTVEEAEIEAPEPKAIVFEGETDMEYMVAQAMNESYAQDLAIMEFIASGYETMEMLREADEDTKAAVKDSKIKKFKDTIVGAIRTFIEKVQGIFDSIIRFFKEKLGKDKVFIDKIEDPVMRYYNSGAAREPEKEQPKTTAHGNVVTTVDKKEDIPKEKGTEEIAEPDYNSIMQFMNMNVDTLNTMDFNPDEAAKTGSNKATHTILTAFGPKSFSPYGESTTILEADEGKKRRVSVKEMFGKVREFFSKVFKFEKNKNEAKKKLKAVEKKLTNDKERNPEEQKKILKAFSEFKQAVLSAIGTISGKAKNARSAFVRFFSKCAGKVFKGKQPKNEMAMALSESTLGMMIYEEYTSGIEYVAEEDVAQVADGVDVTDVIDGVIEKDETVTKEKTVSINNESYRVKVSATRL